MNLKNEISLTKVLKDPAVTPNDYFTAAKGIADEYFPNGDTISIQSITGACFDIDQCKVKKIGQHATTYRMNNLISLVLDHIAAVAKNPERLSQEIGRGNYGILSEWITPKFEILKQRLELISVAVDWMKRFNTGRIINTAGAFTSYGDLKLQIDDLFKELVTLQTYGIKPCSFEDGLFSRTGKYWTYFPSNYIYGTESDNSIEKSSYRIKSSIERSRIMASVSIASEKNLVVQDFQSLSSAMSGITFSTDLAFSICIDGGLYAFNSPGIISIEKIALRENLLPVYEVLRLGAIMRLYDLVVPMYIIGKSAPLPVVKRILGISTGSTSLEPTLILQRVRLVLDEKHSVVEEALEKEVLTAPAVTTITTEKGVIWHARKLPAGYKASRDAIAMAKEYLNRDLLPTETFVKAYHKNVGGRQQTGVHQVRQRH